MFTSQNVWCYNTLCPRPLIHSLTVAHIMCPQSLPNFFRGPHKLLHSSLRAGHLT